MRQTPQNGCKWLERVSVLLRLPHLLPTAIPFFTCYNTGTARYPRFKPTKAFGWTKRDMPLTQPPQAILDLVECIARKPDLYPRLAEAKTLLTEELLLRQIDATDRQIDRLGY